MHFISYLNLIWEVYGIFSGKRIIIIEKKKHKDFQTVFKRNRDDWTMNMKMYSKCRAFFLHMFFSLSSGHISTEKCTFNSLVAVFSESMIIRLFFFFSLRIHDVVFPSFFLLLHRRAQFLSVVHVEAWNTQEEIKSKWYFFLFVTMKHNCLKKDIQTSGSEEEYLCKLWR